MRSRRPAAPGRLDHSGTPRRAPACWSSSPAGAYRDPTSSAGRDCRLAFGRWWISIRPLRGLLDQHAGLPCGHLDQHAGLPCGHLDQHGGPPCGPLHQQALPHAAEASPHAGRVAPQGRIETRRRRQGKTADSPSGRGGSTWKRRPQTCWSSSPAGAYRDPPPQGRRSLPRPALAPKAPPPLDTPAARATRSAWRPAARATRSAWRPAARAVRSACKPAPRAARSACRRPEPPARRNPTVAGDGLCIRMQGVRRSVVATRNPKLPS
ncbi:hypothetical protein EDF43_101667 [Rathayibacter sp. PhB179]|nr:hypothetical protein EDF49_101667 [Rathayibacter sp. PhB192]TCM31819.1 hypothetical protein EDF43_101667 [Rathayibacter sp. PhB179]